MSLPPFCPNCTSKIPDGAASCPACQWDGSKPGAALLLEQESLAVPPKKKATVIERSTVRILQDEPIPVELTDINVSFTTLVVFFVKIALAAIPAAFIVWVIYLLIAAFVATLTV